MRGKKSRILVVDDERPIASVFATILAQEGYETATAYSGEEAVQAAPSFQPDFILSDVMMYQLNGIEAAMQILAILPQCKVLFMSGNCATPSLLERARAQGYQFELLEKPVQPKELLRKVLQIMPAERKNAA